MQMSFCSVIFGNFSDYYKQNKNTKTTWIKLLPNKYITSWIHRQMHICTNICTCLSISRKILVQKFGMTKYMHVCEFSMCACVFIWKNIFIICEQMLRKGFFFQKPIKCGKLIVTRLLVGWLVATSGLHKICIKLSVKVLVTIIFCSLLEKYTFFWQKFSSFKNRVRIWKKILWNKLKGLV